MNGYLYQLNPVTGSIQFTSNLTAHGLNECRMTSDGYRLYCGINGHVTGVGLKPV